VLLHVGTPKTGTSYLQDVLFRNRVRLLTQGITYPAERFDAHFLAALDLMKMPWGGLQAEAIGEWDKLADAVRRAPGTAIISHEILATASRSQVSRALESVGYGSGTEVHVILSVRDLVRQIPAEWQENVKHRAGLSYKDFLARIQDPERASRIGSWFWGVQEIPDILNRWGHDLPPEHVHLVTVPPPGAPDLLWKRFSHAFGLDGLDLDLEAERANPSLGVPEIALIRRINRRANKDLHPPDYRPLVRELLAHQTLSQRTQSPRLALPPDVHPWVQSLSESWVEEIRTRGYDVIGELSDLIGSPPVSEYADPDRPSERQVADAAVDAIKALLLDNARLRAEEARLHGELHEAHLALERSYLRPTYRLREKVVRRLESSLTGKGVLKVYRAARGRSSRSA
jgi:hypothetical protein